MKLEVSALFLVFRLPVFTSWLRCMNKVRNSSFFQAVQRAVRLDIGTVDVSNSLSLK